ncbi:hypothetical protein MX850_07615 [Erysipelothrix sp. Poltava]|nr:hypothetical protein MX850_07615 [Erysipelothrix sp. Poltava]
MDTKRFNKNQSDDIAQMIQEGGLVAIMTDTVYGLAASSADGSLYQKFKGCERTSREQTVPIDGWFP